MSAIKHSSQLCFCHTNAGIYGHTKKSSIISTTKELSSTICKVTKGLKKTGTPGDNTSLHLRQNRRLSAVCIFYNEITELCKGLTAKYQQKQEKHDLISKWHKVRDH